VQVRERAADLAAAVQVPVRLVDERLTTVGAAERLRAAGKRTREQRGSIDAAAATLILEHALALERAKGSPPGELVSPGGRG
jgi:putative Holliday junction resolvase